MAEQFTAGSSARSLPTTEWMLGLRLVRRFYRRFKASMKHGNLAASPMFFANSFPKSGTHLLTQVLQGFARIGPAVDSGLPAVVTFDGSTGHQRPTATIIQDLQRLKPGDIAYGHLYAIPEVVAELTRRGVAAYFIFRDPRDVVVSHVHYVTEMAPDHVHHPYYAQYLSTFDQRLETSILGIPGTEIPFPNIYQRFEPYLGWLETSQVFALRYEDFLQSRSEILALILEHAQNRGFQLSLPPKEAVQILDAAIVPEKSPTYRTGQAGKWRTSFTEAHKAIFKAVTGDLLIRLGYEQNNDW